MAAVGTRENGRMKSILASVMFPAIPSFPSTCSGELLMGEFAGQGSCLRRDGTRCSWVVKRSLTDEHPRKCYAALLPAPESVIAIVCALVLRRTVDRVECFGPYGARF